MYGCMLSDIFEYFTNSEVYLSCNITYGACCVDDLSADELGADFLIHYGHSCLVPITQTTVKCMYVFVDIFIDTEHLVKTVEFNFADKGTRLFVLGTI